MKKDKKIISLEIDNTLLESLKSCANNNEMSVSGLIRLILKEYFSNDNKVNIKRRPSK